MQPAGALTFLILFWEVGPEPLSLLWYVTTAAVPSKDVAPGSSSFARICISEMSRLMQER